MRVVRGHLTLSEIRPPVEDDFTREDDCPRCQGRAYSAASRPAH